MRTQPFYFLILLVLFFIYTALKINQLLVGRIRLSWFLAFLFFALSISWQITYRIDPSVLDKRWFHLLSLGGSICLGLWATFLIVSITLDSFHLIYWVYQKFTSIQPIDSTRRRFFSQWTSIGAFGIAGTLSIFGWIEAIAGAKIKKITIPIHNLSPSLHGLKIVQISDLHIGPTINRKYVEKIVQQVQSLQPDLIAITGDLVDGTPETLKAHLKPLEELKAPLGVYFVTGNHEYYWGAEEWIEETKRLGFVPLLNENRVVTYEGAKILIGGVSDTSSENFVKSHRSNPQSAALTTEICNFRLLLAHRPESCFKAEAEGFDLQLSGHTHAGQFFPVNLFVWLVHKYYAGLNRHGKMWVYINSGTGYWGPANRFGVPSEISYIQITRA